ncbi:hypothetical protein L1887_25461 [Cichorium endivia]|nr:hypothetical protein L1887_25461 [Cichorium endivia]
MTRFLALNLKNNQVPTTLRASSKLGIRESNACCTRAVFRWLFFPFPEPLYTQRPPSSSINTLIPLNIFSPISIQIEINTISNPFSFSRSMATSNQSQFHDFLPVMADKLGGDGLIEELCNGFQLLVDREKGVITFDSLKRNASLLGLQDLSDADLLNMVREGDFDGDGALSQMEFCVLMFRLSPDLMEQSEFLLEEALEQEFNNFRH